MKRIGVLVAAVLLLLPVSAEASFSFTAQTNKAGKSCRVNVIAQPLQFGVTVPDCVAARASSTSQLFNGPSRVSVIRGVNSTVPFSNVRTTNRPGNYYISRYALFLPEQKNRKGKNRVKWKLNVKTDDCGVRGYLRPRDTLVCKSYSRIP